MVSLQHIPTQLSEREHRHANGPFANMWSNKQTDKYSNSLTSLHTDKIDPYLLQTRSFATKDTEMKKSDHHNKGT